MQIEPKCFGRSQEQAIILHEEQVQPPTRPERPLHHRHPHPPRSRHFPGQPSPETVRATKRWLIYKLNFGAEEGTRTPTPLRVRGPEPRASANSATSARDTYLTLSIRPAATLSLAKPPGRVKSAEPLRRRLEPIAPSIVSRCKAVACATLAAMDQKLYFRFNASSSSSVRGQSDPSRRDRLRSANTFPPV